jgi:sec-independent protein translocase protein TatA
MGLSTTHLLLLLVVVVLLFGRNKISDLMGDVARGIKSFRKGMAEDDAEPPKAIGHAGKAESQSDRDKSKTI